MSQSENRHDTISLLIEGMTCASCVARVEKGIKAVPGVTDATVNLATERATVRGTASAEAVIAAIEKTGYEARPVETAGQGEDDSEEKKEAERVRLKRDPTMRQRWRSPTWGWRLAPAPMWRWNPPTSY